MMKKWLLTCISVFMLITLAAPIASASTLSAVATVNGNTIEINGTYRYGSNREVTLVVTDPLGNINYLNQATTLEGGAFHFSFSLKNNAINGIYKATVGGDGIKDTAVVDFQYSAASSPVSPPSGGTPSVIPEESENMTTDYPIGDAEVITDIGSNGKPISVLTLDTAKLAKIFETLKMSDGSEQTGGRTIRIVIADTHAATSVRIPALSLVQGSSEVSDAILSIETSTATYQLPIGLIDVGRLTQEMNVSADSLFIELQIEQMENENEEIKNNLKRQGFTMLTGAVSFTIIASSPSKSHPITDFGGVYVERMIPVPSMVNASRSSAFLYDPATGDVSFVPTIFITNEGVQKAVIKRPGNSIYVIAEGNKTFDDTSNHWARLDIESLASKGIVKGNTETHFAAEDSITRAQFSALLVRSLGLSVNSSTHLDVAIGTSIDSVKFSDILPDAWYASYVSVAAESGLIRGYEDGTFRPMEEITREQMTVMITRALNIAGKQVNMDSKKENELLLAFKDANDINEWAKSSVAVAIEAGIINGVTTKRFAAQEQATRAQAVVMLKRLLQHVQFIN